MSRRAKAALGVHFGERQIRIALVEKGPQGVRTLAAASEAWSSAEPGQAPDKVLSRLLGQVGRRGRLRGIRAAVAVSSAPLVVRLLDWPQHVPTNMGLFVAKELEQYVALSGKTVVSDFCGVGTGVQKHLLTAAGDADHIQEVVKACSAAGIVVDVVEPALLACARACLQREQGMPRADNVLIALLGARLLTILLLRRGTLGFVRTRDLPADTTTPRLLSAWLAEELKTVMRYLEMQATRADRAGRVQVVLQESKHRTEEIAPLFAAEAAARSLPIDVGAPVRNDPSAPGVSTIAEGAALALLDMEGDDLKINLLPKAVREARSLSRHLLLTGNLCVLVFLGILAVAQLLARTTGTIDRRIEQSRLSGELYAAPALFAKEKFLDREIAQMRQRVDPLRQATHGRRPADWPGIFEAVRQAAPAEVSVTQVQCSDGQTLSVKGVTSSCPAAQAFVRNLESRPPFASVSLATVQRQPERNPTREASHLGPQADCLEYRIDCLLKVKGGPSS